MSKENMNCPVCNEINDMNIATHCSNCFWIFHYFTAEPNSKIIDEMNKKIQIQKQSYTLNAVLQKETEDLDQKIKCYKQDIEGVNNNLILTEANTLNAKQLLEQNKIKLSQYAQYSKLQNVEIETNIEFAQNVVTLQYEVLNDKIRLQIIAANSNSEISIPDLAVCYFKSANSTDTMFFNSKNAEIIEIIPSLNISPNENIFRRIRKHFDNQVIKLVLLEESNLKNLKISKYEY